SPPAAPARRRGRTELEGPGAWRLPALPPVPQQVIGEDDGQHRLAHGHGADADAGIVATLGDDVDILALLGDTLARGQDRTGRLHREAHDDVLAGGDAAEDAAGVVGEERDLAVLHAHLVGIGLAGQARGLEAGADLDTFHRVDAHHGG